MNLFVFVGNLTHDPEMRKVGGDKSVVKFRVAINGRKFKDGDGNVKQDTTYVDCEAWGNGGELIHQYFKKGSPILVSESEVRMDSWTDKESGEKRSKLFVRVLKFEFLPKNNTTQENQTTEKPATKGRKKAPVEDSSEADIPF